MQPDMKFCQSCAMPLTTPQEHGINKDGSQNDDYCVYCFKDGAFTADVDMEGMIEACVPFCVEHKVYADADTARAEMRAFFPTLKRWRA